MMPANFASHRPRPWLVACALAWMALACSSSDTSAPQDVGGSDGGAPPDAGSVPTDDASSGHVDGGVDSSPPDAAPPAAPSCHAGDRQEFAGPIPNTAVAVAV